MGKPCIANQQIQFKSLNFSFFRATKMENRGPQCPHKMQNNSLLSWTRINQSHQQALAQFPDICVDETCGYRTLDPVCSDRHALRSSFRLFLEEKHLCIDCQLFWSVFFWHESFLQVRSITPIKCMGVPLPFSNAFTGRCGRL